MIVHLVVDLKRLSVQTSYAVELIGCNPETASALVLIE